MVNFHYTLFEVEPSKKIVGVPQGTFDNEEAAMAYLTVCFSPLYDRIMLVSKSVLHSQWPIPLEELIEPENRYFVKRGEEVVEV